MSTVERPVIVAGYDGSAAAHQAVMWAAGEAASRRIGLVVIQAVGMPALPEVSPTPALWVAPQFNVDQQKALLDHAASELESIADACRKAHPGLAVTPHAVSGRGPETLAETASEAELLVIGPSGRTALPRVLLGSTASELMYTYQRPIVIVRQDSPGKGVVVGIDGSNTSAVDFAFDFADRHGHELLAVHAWSDLPLDALAPVRTWDYAWQDIHDKAEQMFVESLAGHRKRHPDVDVRQVISPDRPAHALIEHAQDAALLVVGSHGRGALKRALLGSVSHSVANHAPCPVAIVRSPDA
ncbi:universal stress protein [Kibdelosporangium philippinense]|uniref:Universal stress protein n=1 Tax=Kibdelosporangium philippinense TaxID=211113 RepID=A0ABS8ZBF8_9PSEU|nr:universal stress protein [Kibdelosporangium philippinense]MCE7004747.1 universal stress protein [Kibdelosporangium philippinense]